MDLRRLEASGDQAGLLRELLRRGLSDEARAVAWGLIQDGEDWYVEDNAGVARPVFREGASDWLVQGRRTTRRICVEGTRVPTLWTPQREKLFACDVVEHVRPILEGACLPMTSRLQAVLPLARLSTYESLEPWLVDHYAVPAWAGIPSPTQWKVGHLERMLVKNSSLRKREMAFLLATANNRLKYLPKGTGPLFKSNTIDFLFLWWHLGEVPEYAE